MRASAAKRLIFALGSLFLASPGIAVADDVKLIDCAGASLPREVVLPPGDRPITIIIRGTCANDVIVKRDDVTLVGEVPTATVAGTITILGARRVLIRGLTVSNPGGAGISGTENAAFTVEDSFLERNGTEGISVRNGAHATIRGTSLSYNGQAGLPDTGRGIHATHGGSVDASNNTILNNRSDGVGVFNGSYARLVENTIEGNGRLEAGEAGIQVNRARVRANGNIIRNNTGLTAVGVYNHSVYRTGSGLNSVDFPNNEYAFERIEHSVDSGRMAIDMGSNSFGDFRQVDIVGSISVGAQTMMQVRGDDVGTSQRCSTINVPAGGFFSVSGRNGLLRLRFTNVTPATISVGTPNGQVDGGTTCAVP